MASRLLSDDLVALRMREAEIEEMNEIENLRQESLAAPNVVNSNTVALSGPLAVNSKTDSKTDTAAGPARSANQIDRALAEFEERATPDEATIIGVLMKNAVLLQDAREHRLAMNILRNVLIRCPDHPDALLRMGICMRETGRHEESLKCFRALLKTGRKLEGQILIAETYYMCERDDLALASYRDVLKQVISDKHSLFEIYKNVGNIYVRAGEFEAAEEFYNKAYTLQPNSDVLMVNYGTLEIQRDALAEAVLRFRRSVEINPDNDKGWVGLALVHRQMGDLDLAWANVHRALDINKRNRTALRLIVEWGVNDHRVSAAIERLEEYLSIDGEDAEMSFTLAKLLTHAGRLAEARLELERVLALDPGLQGADNLREALDRELSPRPKNTEERSH